MKYTMNDLYMLSLEISYDAGNLKDLSQAIKNADEVYVKDPTEDNYTIMLAIIEDYKKLVNKCRIRLEAYFKVEEELGLEKDFLFRRLYKKLQNAY